LEHAGKVDELCPFFVASALLTSTAAAKLSKFVSSFLNSNLMRPDFPHNIRIRLARLKLFFVASWRC
jgi:hypothetical protein